MIKFFRKIRQKLLSENKFGKYLIYAIGEIFLVVIGILIALQINNWNEERKDSIKEQQILSQLKEDYEANLKQLDQKISSRMSIIQAGNEILKYIDQPTNIHNDSIVSKLSVISGWATFDPIQNDLFVSGNIRLIKNSKLKRLLSNWSSDIVALQEVEVIWTKMLWESAIPLFVRNEIMMDVFTKWWSDENNLKWILEGSASNPFEKRKLDKTVEVSDVLINKELEGIVSVAISLNQSANIQSQVLRKRIIETLELLDQDIKIK
ncbi:MAG: hypothetical protein IPJ74_00890 [Saprospiraceae bacterium]|nr:hypothetical protein [Saprospiraceae bacterium]